MPADKLPVDELLRLACLYAEQNREEFVEAYARCPSDPAAVEAEEFLSQLRAYRKRRWGRTKHEASMARATAVPISELRQQEQTDAR